MAMNSMSISQASTLLNAIVKQATGQTAQAVINDAADLVSVAQTALLTGYDPIFNAVSQVWSRTVFSSRPYTTKFGDLEISLGAYGNAIRKLSAVSGLMLDDDQYKWPVAYDATGHSGNPLGNGQSVDPYTIAKQEVLQTNFYGVAVYQQDYTIFRHQLKTAFSDAAEFASFNQLNMQERSNDREQFREQVGRVLQLNLIGALIDEAQETRVVKLLTEYNELTGLTLTAQDVYKPENFPAFIRWMYSRVNTIAKMMGERSQQYQTVINNKPVLRHTPIQNLRVALGTSFYEQVNSMAIPDTYNPQDLSLPQFNPVNYWQSIDEPTGINMKPTYTDNTGAVKTASVAVKKANVVGIMHDENAIGYSIADSWAAPSPFNQKGGYWNESYHEEYKTISDCTEKAVVLLLE